MQRTRPLLDHPEFLVINIPELSREYRVENWRIVRDGSRRIIRGTSGLGILDGLVMLLVAALWPMTYPHRVRAALLFASLACYLHARCTQVLWESVLAFPGLGLQFETARGFPPHALFVSRTFLPLGQLQDVIVNEGLHRWDVRFYLAALPISGSQLGVAFPVRIRPLHVRRQLIAA
ncbi:hypothetical protein K488DRAFT_50270 [Vararia minispora EC-137]|uniref:Uncharacterized protein n=1 Tax=Vararia minispora EC-137 TaxID=1314806 RepID=A0ACB8QKC5_9AGAM|nr:hypothetical protein K488DRAFT_50270 [Vararia minispora EC-137]